MATPSESEAELAERLLGAWDQGRGKSKSKIEIDTWGDATSHGRHFDRFIRQTLGVSTTRPSKQTDRIRDLESQVRGLGHLPRGAKEELWERQLMHARRLMLEALRVWNDPISAFRAGGFALLFVAAWNSLAIAIQTRGGAEWRQLDRDGHPIVVGGVEQAASTHELVESAFPGVVNDGLRQNTAYWIEIRNHIAHRHLPVLDHLAIPHAQSGLLNFENQLEACFGPSYLLAEALTVPLQLSGFRDPGALRSLKSMQASLPLEVQGLLARIDEETTHLQSDPTYMLRVALIPAVPPSGRSPDAIAYFVKPGEVPDDLADALDKYVVLPKPVRTPRPNMGAKTVVSAVGEEIPYRFTTWSHTQATRRLKVRPCPGDGDPADTDLRYCEYVQAAKLHLYNQAWIDRLISELATEDGYRDAVGRDPVAKEVG